MHATSYTFLTSILLHLSSLSRIEQTSITVFENHRKSLIQHCERSELHLHFEWTKVNWKWQKWSILASFWKLEACGHTVLPDRSILMGQKLAENAKLQKFKCDILSNCNNVRTYTKKCIFRGFREANVLDNVMGYKRNLYCFSFFSFGLYQSSMSCYRSCKRKVRSNCI